MATREYKACVGSISSGTHIAGSLIDSYAFELRRFRGNAGDGRLTVQEVKLIDDCDAWLEENGSLGDGEGSETLLDDLREALESRAPAYCYFGANEGDGACFGFWPCVEQIDELPCVEDSDGAKLLGEDCRFVNDHGNVTVFGGNGAILLDIV